MASNPERRRLLEQIIPESMIVTRNWLMEEASLDKHAIDNLVKSEQLKLLWKGLYTRGNILLSWQSMVLYLANRYENGLCGRWARRLLS